MLMSDTPGAMPIYGVPSALRLPAPLPAIVPATCVP